MSQVNLPYNLREGQVARAAQVMANFLALLGAYGSIKIEGLGEGDVETLMQLMYEAMVKAGEPGNTEGIVFHDGDTLEQKFAAGTLNASILNSEGLFYFEIDPISGHLIVTAAEGIGEEDFLIDGDGHLIFNLEDPETSSVVHRYDLGRVVGEQGPAGAGGMDAAVYDPRGVRKDLNPYLGSFICYAPKWGSYFRTEDTVAQEGKTYYAYLPHTDEYVVRTYPAGTDISELDLFEKLDETEYRLTDEDHVGGEPLSGHIAATSGHAFLGPSYLAGPVGAEAWANARIWAKEQGDGWVVLKALGDVPRHSINIQAIMIL